MKIYVDMYLAKNLGDDLFLYILSHKFPEIEFTVNYYGDDYGEVFSEYANVIKPNYTVFNKILNRVHIYDYINDADRISKKYDALLFLGGSIFREEYYWREEYEKRYRLVEAFNKKNKSIWILGANFGPVKTKKFIEDYGRLFENCTDVCFRDKYSFNLFRKIENIRYAPDIVYCLQDFLKLKRKNIKREIAISVIEPNHVEGLDRYRENSL